MTLYWTSFIKNGNPNTEKHPGAPIWPAYQTTTDKNLALGVEARGGARVEAGYRSAECTYWGALGAHNCFKILIDVEARGGARVEAGLV